MDKKKPQITVVIPHRAEEPVSATVEALAGHNSASFEVLTVSGNQPSFQRNRAVEQARGDYVYFLDNDSIPEPGNLDRIVSFFAEHPQAAVLGGPSLTPATDSAGQRGRGRVLGSFWGTVFMRARYRAVGRLRRTTDRELILCNMALRREVFEQVGAFNEKLYPNEENELMDRIRAAGYDLYYDPDLGVYRSQRTDTRAFVRQMTGYGRGRAEQLRTAFQAANLPLFVFMAWPVYLMLLPAACAVAGLIPLLPPAAYLAGCFGFALPSLREGPAVFWFVFTGFIICHLFYGVGMWTGLFGRYRSASVEPGAEVVRVKSG